METKMELTLEILDRIERRLGEWGGWFSLTTDEKDLLIAAARAHLKNQELARGFMARRSQPPQQREDGMSMAGCIPFTDGSMWYDHAPAPSSTVEPAKDYYEHNYDRAAEAFLAPDAGLVERLRKNDYAKDMPLQREAAAALEAKDAEIARLRRMLDECDHFRGRTY
jgi:hypothetical protein